MECETTTYWGLEFYRKGGRWVPANAESLERVVAYWIAGADRDRDHQQWVDDAERLSLEAER